MIRAELMKTSAGRSALMSGVPEKGMDLSALTDILQVPCPAGYSLAQAW